MNVLILQQLGSFGLLLWGNYCSRYLLLMAEFQPSRTSIFFKKNHPGVDSACVYGKDFDMNAEIRNAGDVNPRGLSPHPPDVHGLRWPRPRTKVQGFFHKDWAKLKAKDHRKRHAEVGRRPRPPSSISVGPGRASPQSRPSIPPLKHFFLAKGIVFESEDWVCDCLNGVSEDSS